ncbi:hypothetical protein [Intestinimonas massiliensis (ex Afouda et al. 2020)]|uniref:hypothetical protein n=1 Tax=Intestinimonas massiliensis (ex Afouda et al. 2020) TaxID=1673721 RepID=UPI00067ECD86|nr:hypothetical protein [Intestinimonas massiliensis (ex Afouda et al. 2020)]
MDRIDRLIIKAKKAAQAKSERFIMGSVTYAPDRGQYRACGHLWSGKKGAGCRYIVSWHDSPDAAMDALYSLADEYPNTQEDSPIFYDDMNQGEDDDI